jgi:hypothetical protein
MELTQEMNQLLLCCKDKEYIKNNLETLRVYFSIPNALNLLKLSLTTNKNFTALKIIEKLNIKIMPFIYINSFTYVSLFWLNKMEMLEEKEEFLKIIRKFQILKDFDVLEEETENKFMKLQIEKKRRQFSNKRRKSNIKIDLIQRLDNNNSNNSNVNNSNVSFMKPSLLFIFNLDELFNIEDLIENFSDLKNGLFSTDLKTFEEFPNDPERVLKQNKFKELKGRLINCPIRNFSNFFNLDLQSKLKLEELMDALSKIKKGGFKYYLISERPLSTILTFCYLFINCMDLTKIIEIKSAQDVNSINWPVAGKKISFPGNIKYKFLRETISNLSRFIDKTN